jgi:putative selenium metabolism hydrolase
MEEFTTPIDYSALSALADQKLSDAVGLAREMIRRPSLSGLEADVAEFVAAKMREMNYDEVRVDEAGNVIGLIKGCVGDSTLMFNCHLDTVDFGERSRWLHDPFSGDVEEGYLWGLGASDTKGAFACQIVAMAALVEAGMRPVGDVYVVGVVHEESSGFGSTYLAPRLKAGTVIIGEATGNDLKIGHRGRLQFDVHLKGKAAHASAPDRGINPHYSAARLVLAIECLQLKKDEFFGATTIAPTLYVTDQSSSNVTPGEVVVSLDCRNIPAESEAEIRLILEELLSGCLQPGVTADIELKMRDVTCYTGKTGRALAGEPCFATPADDPGVMQAQLLLSTAFGRDVKVGACQFATDGGHFRLQGSKVIIFSPAEEKHCHTSEDCVSIDKMREAILGNMVLALGLSGEK